MAALIRYRCHRCGATTRQQAEAGAEIPNEIPCRLCKAVGKNSNMLRDGYSPTKLKPWQRKRGRRE